MILEDSINCSSSAADDNSIAGGYQAFSALDVSEITKGHQTKPPI